MKYSFLLIAALALGGCATDKGVILPKTVEVPVAMPCKTATPDKPAYHFNPPYATIFEGTRDLMGDRDQSLAYEIQLEAALKSCK